MAAIAETAQAARMPAPGRARTRRRSFPAWRWVILLVAAAYFLIPLYSALKFAGFKAFTQVTSYPSFGQAF